MIYDLYQIVFCAQELFEHKSDTFRRFKLENFPLEFILYTIKQLVETGSDADRRRSGGP